MSSSSTERARRTWLVCLGIALGCGVPGTGPFTSAFAQEQKAGAATVRQEIGKPIQAALDLIKNRKGKDALAKVREADAVKDKTPFETYLVERVRGQAAAAAGEASVAAQAFEAVANSAAAPVGERVQFLGAAAGQYYAAKDYGKAAESAARYFRDGGTDRSVRTIQIQALYLGNDFARAAKELMADIQSGEQAGRKPAEEQLQLLANAYLKQKDAAGYSAALEKLVAFYPKRDYWLAAIHNVTSLPGFSDRFALDVGRLKLATGTMRSAAEYVETAQLSLQAGFPAEAKKIVERGFAAGLLGTGPDAERHKRLRDMATRSLAEDTKSLEQEDAQAAAAKDGMALVNAGYNYVLHGRADRGLEMIEQGMRKGGLKRLDDARLLLGNAYQLAGQNQKSIQAFRTVHGTDGAAALARLWIVHLGRAS